MYNWNLGYAIQIRIQNLIKTSNNIILYLSHCVITESFMKQNQLHFKNIEIWTFKTKFPIKN